MLNSDTLLLVQVVFTVLITLLLVSEALVSDALQEQRLWAIGNVALCCGLAIGYATDLPIWIHGALSYGVIGLGLALVLRGLRIFCGKNLSVQAVACIAALACLLPLYFCLAQPSLQARLVVTGFYFGLLNFACAVILLRESSGEVRNGMWATLLGFIAIGAALLVRSIVLVLHGSDESNISYLETVMSLTLLTITAAQVCVGFGLVVMVAHRYASRLNRLTMVDSLTGAYNRSALERIGIRMTTRAHQSGSHIAVAMVDADHFKHINDVYGHPAGDQVLCNLVAVLSAQLRPSDLLVRYGGEEFVLVMDGLTLDGASAVAERLRGAIEVSAVQLGDKALNYQVSIGVSASDTSGYDLQRLIEVADTNLYVAKQGGRNRVHAA
jgi:diguanylate cyclase (GGDEF)-like protein